MKIGNDLITPYHTSRYSRYPYPSANITKSNELKKSEVMQKKINKTSSIVSYTIIPYEL